MAVRTPSRPRAPPGHRLSLSTPRRDGAFRRLVPGVDHLPLRPQSVPFKSFRQPGFPFFPHFLTQSQSAPSNAWQGNQSIGPALHPRPRSRSSCTRLVVGPRWDRGTHTYYVGGCSSVIASWVAGKLRFPGVEGGCPRTVQVLSLVQPIPRGVAWGKPL